MQKIVEVPTHWTDPPPQSTKIKLNCIIELARGSDKFKEVKKTFRADLIKGFAKQYAMKVAAWNTTGGTSTNPFSMIL